LLRLLPEGQSRLFQDAWDEFTAGASPEARLVRDADKLEMVLQAMEYEKLGYGGSLMRFWHSKPIGRLPLALYEEMRRRR
jgi:5'-deoxynucleotidase YfbR-like HD superfamily hydrolase